MIYFFFFAEQVIWVDTNWVLIIAIVILFIPLAVFCFCKGYDTGHYTACQQIKSGLIKPDFYDVQFPDFRENVLNHDISDGDSP